MTEPHEHKNETHHATPAKADPHPAAAKSAADAQLARSKEINDKILAAQVEREKWMPTPTQEENDQAALGHPVAQKKPDGSPVEQTAEQTRQMEAAKKPGGGYQTRSAA